MGNNQLDVQRITPFHHEEHRGIGIKEPDDLLGEEIGDERAEFEGVGHQAEQTIRRLHPRQLLRGKLLVELRHHIRAHLFTASEAGHWRLLEGQTHRVFDQRGQAVYQALDITRLQGARRIPAAAPEYREHQGARGSHGCQAVKYRRYHSTISGPMR